MKYVEFNWSLTPQTFRKECGGGVNRKTHKLYAQITGADRSGRAV
jgi:hypothetical protein